MHETNILRYQPVLVSSWSYGISYDEDRQNLPAFPPVTTSKLLLLLIDRLDTASFNILKHEPTKLLHPGIAVR